MLIFWLLLQSSGASKYMTVAFGDGFQDVAVQSSIPAGSVVPTGKDNSIVSNGSIKVIPAGRTILFLVAITFKTKGSLDYLSFDDLYNKLRTLEIDVKGGSS
ncbi:hypothetical protein Tco_0389880, partial [Tanacetum coccineum]